MLKLVICVLCTALSCVAACCFCIVLSVIKNIIISISLCLLATFEKTFIYNVSVQKFVVSFKMRHKIFFIAIGKLLSARKNHLRLSPEFNTRFTPRVASGMYNASSHSKQCFASHCRTDSCGPCRSHAFTCLRSINHYREHSSYTCTQ